MILAALGFRLHIEWAPHVRGLAVWAPWRRPSDPLIYAFWLPAGRGWRRAFTRGDK